MAGTKEEAEAAMRREIGARIRAAREWARLEQRTVAEHLGVHADTLKGWESGRRRAPREQIDEIAAYTKAPLWFLLGGWEGWREEQASPDVGRQLDGVERMLEEQEEQRLREQRVLNARLADLERRLADLDQEAHHNASKRAQVAAERASLAAEKAAAEHRSPRPGTRRAS